MKFAVGFVVLVVALTLAKLWTSGETNFGMFAAVTIGVGLGVILVAWVVGVWMRKRQRRLLMETRDSALW